MTRIKAGDYLLLVGETVWRIKSYTEDGSLGTCSECSGKFWAIWKYIGRTPDAIDPDAWEDFDMYDCLIRTRRAAVARAISDTARDYKRPVAEVPPC